MIEQQIQLLPIEILQAKEYTKNFLDSIMPELIKKIKKEIANLKFMLSENFEETPVTTQEELAEKFELLVRKRMSGKAFLEDELTNIEGYYKFVFLPQHFSIIFKIVKCLQNIDQSDKNIQSIVVDSIYDLSIKRSSTMQTELNHFTEITEENANLSIRCDRLFLSFYENLSSITRPGISMVYMKLVEPYFPLTMVTLQEGIVIGRDFLDPKGIQKVINFALNVPLKLLKLEKRLNSSLINLLELDQQLKSLKFSFESTKKRQILNEIQQLKQKCWESLKIFFEFWKEKIEQSLVVGAGIKNDNEQTIIYRNELLNKDTMINAAINQIHKLYVIAKEVSMVSKKFNAYIISINSTEKADQNQLELQPLIAEKDIIDTGESNQNEDVEQIILQDNAEDLDVTSKEYASESPFPASPLGILTEGSKNQVIYQFFPNSTSIDEIILHMRKLFPELSNKKLMLLISILEEKKLTWPEIAMLAGTPIVGRFDPTREGSRSTLTFTNQHSIHPHIPHHNDIKKGAQALTRSSHEEVQEAVMYEVSRRLEPLISP